MTTSAKINLKIIQGSTFSETFRYEGYLKEYVQITGISTSAPMVVTVPSHSVPVGWRGRISGVKGMKEVNSEDYITVTDSTVSTLTFNGINSTTYTPYISGGIFEYNIPKSLSGVTARMQIRPKVSSDIVLLDCSSMIVLDDTMKTITLTIPAASTELLNFKTAVYSMELVNGSIVTPFIYGNITLVAEITR